MSNLEGKIDDNIDDEIKMNANIMEECRVILVTGANKGIGLAVVELLLDNKGNQVILGCRSFNSIPQMDNTGKVKNDPALSALSILVIH